MLCSLFMEPRIVCNRKLKTSLLLVVALAILPILASNSFATTFTAADFEGTWRYYGLISGDSPTQTPGWYYGSHTMDTNGNITASSVITDSLGNSSYTPSGGAFSITTTGIVTVGPLMRGFMNASKNLLVLVGTMCPGNFAHVCGYNLLIAMKDASVSFNAADLAGTWQYHGLISGDGPAQTPGWYYGSHTIDTSGAATSSSVITDSLGNASYTPSGIGFALSSTGIITAGGFLHGCMNASKDLMVIVGIMCPGDAAHVCGYNLMILSKVWTSTFTTADLAGTWFTNGLIAGDALQWTGWAHGEYVLDDNGSGTIAVETSSGATNSGSAAFTLSASGGIGGGPPGTHGVMTADRSLIIQTMNDGGNGYGFWLGSRTMADTCIGDINNDQKIGLEEVINALQVVSDTRSNQ